MSALLPLRDYQKEAIADLHSRWDAGDTRVPMVLATGLGKTVIFAHLIADWIRSNVAKRALVLVHTDELVRQAVKKIQDSAPHLRVGIVKAEQNDVTARVIVASVQSLRSTKRRHQIRNVGLIIVDECHHATAPTYRAILEHFGAMASAEWSYHLDDSDFQPRCKVAGFTATLARGDKAKLSDVWQACTFTRGIAFGIRRGYLLDVRGKRVIVPDMELSNVKKSGGDYADGSLAEELDRSFAPSIVADAYVEHALLRKGVGFAPTVESAHHFAEAFEAAGIPSAVVSGQTPQEERRLILKRLHSGDVQVVWNCAVLTEGFDEPTISCIVNARPTRSAPLYQQMVGRGLRPNLELPPEERGDCLVLDVTPLGVTHNLRTLVDLSERAPEGTELNEDQSLLELEDELEELEREEAEAPDTAEDLYYGETIAIDFDPLARTGIGAWLQTYDGTYFLPAGKSAYVLIVPSVEPALWDVAWLTQSPNHFLHKDCWGMRPYVSTDRLCSCDNDQHQGGQGDLTEHRALSLDMACSWAEEVLEELGGDAALLEAGAREHWRSAPITFQWRKQCMKYGIEITKGMRRGDVHDRVSELLGSKRIDPVVAFMKTVRSEDSETG